MSYVSLLNNIHDGSDLWTIAVRVLRRWNVYQKTSPTELFCVSFILVDAEGTKIQASLINQSMHPRFQSIKEGQTYEFANFVVSPNTHNYKPTNHPYKITFTSHTYVMEEEAALPLASYSFKTIQDILSLKKDEEIDHLFDLIAFVKCIAPLDEQRKANELKYKLRMILTDDEENEVECVLFDQCASDAYMAQLQNDDTPVVVLLNLAKLGWTEHNERQVSSSFHATRVSFNPPIKEVKDLIQRAKDRGSPVFSALSQPMPTQLTQDSRFGSLHNQKKLKIAEIPERSSGDSFVLSCMLHKFESKYGWSYIGCAKCSSKAKQKDDNSPMVCPSCVPSPDTFEPKMKLHYSVKDDSGTASVIFWDKLAVQLMEKTALQMKMTLPEKNRQLGFPQGLEDPVGKNFLLKLKLNEYNKKFPSSSISVNDFTLCQDLMTQFDSSSSEDASNPMNISAKDIVLDTHASGDPNPHIAKGIESSVGSAGKDAIDLDDPNISIIPNNISQAPSKAKRRSYMKRNIPREDLAKDPQPSTNLAHEARVMKVIKKEK